VGGGEEKVKQNNIEDLLKCKYYLLGNERKYTDEK